jgi:aquaporin Z
MRAVIPKLVTEFAGTFVFLTVIGLSSAAGALAPLAIGLALMAMVYMGGHVSGAHYNPAVSFALFLRRIIGVQTMLAYWVTQLVAGVLAFALAYAISGHAANVHATAGWPAALAAEVLFTTALVLVVLNVAATKETEGNSFYGLAIGMTVAAGAFVAGPISGGVFNPAVGIGATLSDQLFAGGGSWSSLWLYILGPAIGSAIGAAIHYVQAPLAQTLPPETSEATSPLP